MTRDILEIEVDTAVGGHGGSPGPGHRERHLRQHPPRDRGRRGRSRPEIRKILEESAMPVGRIEKIVPSLEDVFVTLIEES